MSEKHAVLVVDDDPGMRETCTRILSRAGFETEAVADGEAALTLLRAAPRFGMVLLDLKLPKVDGVRVLEKIRKLDSNLKVVMMTGFATVQSAVQTMKLGAVDYLVKPFEKDELLAVTAQQFRVAELENTVDRLQGELRTKHRFDNLVGRSREMHSVFEQIRAACNNNANVLIVGDNGTGKEVVARAIHYNGLSSTGPFVAVNCAALPEALIESELFGHVKGAFTGAVDESAGLFRSATGGTIFLDEVFEMPPSTQAKFLRAIQERKVRAVGALQETDINVRIIAASNRQHREALEAGHLRQDLFYRLCVVFVRLPALRDREEDVFDLIDHFTEKFAKIYDFRIGGLERDVLIALRRYAWPGNVRELENLVERWFAMGRKASITVDDLPAGMIEQAQLAPGKLAEVDPGRIVFLHDAERAAALRALEAAGRNKSKAARLLGISRKKLYALLAADTHEPGKNNGEEPT